MGQEKEAKYWLGNVDVSKVFSSIVILQVILGDSHKIWCRILDMNGVLEKEAVGLFICVYMYSYNLLLDVCFLKYLHNSAGDEYWITLCFINDFYITFFPYRVFTSTWIWTVLYHWLTCAFNCNISILHFNYEIFHTYSTEERKIYPKINMQPENYNYYFNIWKVSPCH